MAKTINILSIDGGGIRGIIPAIILADLEARLGKPLASVFDLIAGTSAGGLIALGLTRPDMHGRPRYTAADMVRLFENDGPKVFHRSLLHRVNTFDNWLDVKYPSEGLDKVLDHYFGHAQVKDAITDVLVTAYEIERRVAYFFKSTKAKIKKERNFLMRYAARATVAAPTYFEPAYIPTEDLSEYYAMIDGGVFANNPAMCAYIEAKTMYPDAKQFLVVSLGTGVFTRPMPYTKTRRWGKAQWAVPILNTVFDGVSDTVDYQLDKLLPTTGHGRYYYRFQTRLEKGDDDMDNVSRDNIRILKLLGEEIVREEKDALERLTEQLG